MIHLQYRTVYRHVSCDQLVSADPSPCKYNLLVNACLQILREINGLLRPVVMPACILLVCATYFILHRTLMQPTSHLARKINCSQGTEVDLRGKNQAHSNLVRIKHRTHKYTHITYIL